MYIAYVYNGFIPLWLQYHFNTDNSPFIALVTTIPLLTLYASRQRVIEVVSSYYQYQYETKGQAANTVKHEIFVCI